MLAHTAPADFDLRDEMKMESRAHARKMSKKKTGKVEFQDMMENYAFFHQIGRPDIVESFQKMHQEVEDLKFESSQTSQREYLLQKKLLLKEKDQLETKIRVKHMQLLELGDPDEIAVTRTEFKDGIWIVENYRNVPVEGMELALKLGQDLEILCCEGTAHHPAKFRVKGIGRKLLIDNCYKVEVEIDGCTNEVIIEECKNVTLVLGGEVPNVRIANCAGIGIVLNHNLIDGRIETERTAGVIVSSHLSKNSLFSSVEDLRNEEVMVSAELASFTVTTVHAGHWVTEPSTDSILDFHAAEHHKRRRGKIRIAK